MTLIILEGPDCAGKTTFAGRLVDRLRQFETDASVGYRHCGVPVEPPLDEYAASLFGYLPTYGHVVCDRWHVGEYVYPRVTGRATSMTDGVLAWIELFLRSRGALLVHCDATDPHLIACGVARGRRGDAADPLRAAAALFREYVARRTLLPTLAVDVSDPDRANYDEVVEEVVGYAVREELATAHLNDLVTYVGSPRPALLLVGDRRGTPSHDLAEYEDWPAFAPAPSTSGAWLMDTLTSTPLRVPTHGLQLRDVALVNANDVDDVRAVWETVGRPPTVGLGINARRTLRNQRVPHRAAPHPQYFRRFMHQQRAEYLVHLLGDRVAEAVTA